jgi:hypothetical protein
MKMVKMVSGLFLLAGAIALVIAVIFALTNVCFLATPGGWLELSLVLAVFSIATAVCPCQEKPK